MNDAADFLNGNIARISPDADPIAWNLNHALLALAQQMNEIQQEQRKQSHRLQQIETAVRRLP